MAQVQVSLDGGAQQTGGVTATLAQAAQVSLSDYSGVDVIRWELYDFPPGYGLPPSWVDAGNGVYYSQSLVPPPFDLDPWGKYAIRSIVSGVADETLMISVLSTNGLEDVAYLEANQFSGDQWVAAIKANLRVLDAGGFGGGGGGSLTAPANPGDDGKAAIASGGDLTYAGGSAANNLLIWDGSTWLSGRVALADTNAVSGRLAVSNFALAGSPRSVLTSDGSSNAWSATPNVDRISIGTSLPSTGDLRVYHGFSAVGRNAGGSDTPLWSWGVTSNRLIIGGNDAALSGGLYLAAPTVSAVVMQVGGSARVTADQTYVRISGVPLNFDTSNVDIRRSGTTVIDYDGSTLNARPQSNFAIYVAGTLRWTINATTIAGSTTSNQFLFTGNVANQLMGGNNTSGTPQNLWVRAAGKVSVTGVGADLVLSGGRGNSDVGGSVLIQYNPDDASPVTRIEVDDTGIGFFTATPVAQGNITGSKAGNAALASLISYLVSLGLITDSTT